MLTIYVSRSENLTARVNFFLSLVCRKRITNHPFSTSNSAKFYECGYHDYTSQLMQSNISVQLILALLHSLNNLQPNGHSPFPEATYLFKDTECHGARMMKLYKNVVNYTTSKEEGKTPKPKSTVTQYMKEKRGVVNHIDPKNIN